MMIIIVVFNKFVIVVDAIIRSVVIIVSPSFGNHFGSSIALTRSDFPCVPNFSRSSRGLTSRAYRGLTLARLLANTRGNMSSAKMQLPKVYEEAATFINGLIGSTEDLDGTDLKAAVKAKSDEIEVYCIQKGIAYYEWILPKYIAVHMDNRGGSMLEPLDSHKLLRRIWKEGWSDHEVVTPRSFEKPTGPAGGIHTGENIKLIAASDGLLPDQEEDDMRVFTVTVSHTSSVLRIVDADPPCKGIHQDLCDASMHIDKAKILQTCPSFARPLKTGIRFCVFKSGVEQVCPDLPSFLARSGNAGHGSHQPQTATQVMMGLNRKVHGIEALGREPDINKIALQMEEEEPRPGETWKALV